MTVSAEPATKVGIQSVPREVQVNILTYLRAYDLSAVQLTCRFFNDSDLIDGVVRYSAEHVYSPQFTQEVVKQENGTAPTMYTLEHLRTIELTVVARVLSSPEPKHGFYVSKSWVKKTLLWLEAVNEFPAGSSSNKKKTKHQKDDEEKVLALMESSSKQQYYETRQWDYRQSVKNPIFGPTTEEQRQAIFLALGCDDEDGFDH